MSVLVQRAVVVGVVLCAACGPGEPVATPSPRHLLLVSLDTLRADHLGAYGYTRPTSPHFDALARRGTLFRRAVANAPTTAPSHGALLTSTYSSAFSRGPAPAGPPPGIPTLAELLRPQGFATGAFTDGGYVAGAFGFARGFELYREERVGLEGAVPAVAAWLDTQTAARWFLFVHTYDVHTPYGGSAAARTALGAHGWRGTQKVGAADLDALERAGAPPVDLADLVALYDAGIRHADTLLGELVALLEARGLLETTLVVVTADHGEEFFEHGRTQHRQLYFQPNLHVPLLCLAPGRPPRVVDDTIELVDVLPTVLEILGLPAAPGAMGRSLVPLIDGAERAGDARAYAEGGGGMGGLRTIVTDRWQLLYDPATERARLYDLAADPAARRDVGSAHPDVTVRLVADVRRRMSEAQARRVEVDPPSLAPETRRQLEQLGYLEGAAP